MTSLHKKKLRRRKLIIRSVSVLFLTIIITLILLYKFKISKKNNTNSEPQTTSASQHSSPQPQPLTNYPKDEEKEITIPTTEDLYKFNSEDNFFSNNKQSFDLKKIYLLKSNMPSFLKELAPELDTISTEFILNILLSFMSNLNDTRYNTIQQPVLDSSMIFITDLILTYMDFITRVKNIYNTHSNNKIITNKYQSIFFISTYNVFIKKFIKTKNILYNKQIDKLQIVLEKFKSYKEDNNTKQKFYEKILKVMNNFKTIKMNLFTNRNIFAKENQLSYKFVNKEDNNSIKPLEFLYYSLHKEEDIEAFERMLLCSFFLELFLIFDIEIKEEKEIEIKYSEAAKELNKKGIGFVLKKLNKRKTKERIKEYFGFIKSQFEILIDLLSKESLEDNIIENAFKTLKVCVWGIGAVIGVNEEIRKRAIGRISEYF